MIHHVSVEVDDLERSGRFYDAVLRPLGWRRHLDTDERIWVNEINTIPGFTRFSAYPRLWEATGLSYRALVDRLIALALERHAGKRRHASPAPPGPEPGGGA